MARGGVAASGIHAQAVDSAAEQELLELFRFGSARDAQGGINVGALTPAVELTGRLPSRPR